MSGVKGRFSQKGGRLPDAPLGCRGRLLRHAGTAVGEGVWSRSSAWSAAPLST